jgi:hypothetical protein
VKFESKRGLGRTEADRKITNEPWSSMPEKKKARENEREKPLSGKKKEVCSKEA